MVVFGLMSSVPLLWLYEQVLSSGALARISKLVVDCE